MKKSFGNKRQYSRNRRQIKVMHVNGKRHAAVEVAKHFGKGGILRYVNSPDSEVLAEFIENFDYDPARKSEVLKKYEQMIIPAHGYK